MAEHKFRIYPNKEQEILIARWLQLLCI
ncbi:helix-turn-helix domain-containing protein [Bacillus sp. XF8]|nr:helix-turn-helix domain-containing protein [Bacillus sp. XF8]